MIKPPLRSSFFALVTCALLAAPAINAAPRVLSLDAAKNPKDGCAAKVRELGAAGERVLFTAPQCPTQVLIDTVSSEAARPGGAPATLATEPGRASPARAPSRAAGEGS